MVRNISFWSVMVAVIAVLTFAMVDASYAQQPPSSPGSNGALETAGPNGTTRSCSDFNDAKGALFGVIVPCLSHTIAQASQDMTAYMVDYFRPIFYAFLTLVIIMHGVSTVQGEGQMGPRTFLLLVKIAAVVTFVEALGSFDGLVSVQDVFSIMKGTEDIMARTLLPGGAAEFSCRTPCPTGECSVADYLPSNRPGHLLWAEMDCALAKVLGFAAGGSNGQPSMILAASVLGMLGGFFFGGTFGLAVFFAAIGFLLSLLGFVVRVGFAYMNAYLVAALYMIISPIFISFVLMRGTTQYFQNWVKGLLGAMLTPVIVTAYSVFALLIFDKMLFNDDSMIKQLFNYSHIVSAQRDAKTVNCDTVANNQIALAERSDLANQAGAGAMATSNRNTLIPALSSATNCQVQLPNLEVARANISGMSGNAVEDEKRIYTQLLIDLMKLFVLALLVTNGWKQISQVLVVLSGSAVTPMLLGGLTGQERSVTNSYAQARKSMDDYMVQPTKEGEVSTPGGAAGTAFVERLLPTIGTGAKTFIEGVGR